MAEKYISLSYVIRSSFVYSVTINWSILCSIKWKVKQWSRSKSFYPPVLEMWICSGWGVPCPRAPRPTKNTTITTTTIAKWRAISNLHFLIIFFISNRTENQAYCYIPVVFSPVYPFFLTEQVPLSYNRWSIDVSIETQKHQGRISLLKLVYFIYRAVYSLILSGFRAKTFG